MKKIQFINLVCGVVAGLLFSLGMCMCLLPEWNSFTLGVVLASLGGVALLVMGIISYIKNSKNRKPINWKFVGKITYGVIASLIFGLGMSFIMVWKLMIAGIVLGIIGIVMLLFLLPMFLGFKN